MLEFYSKIQAENEKLAADVRKAEKKIEANNLKRQNKMISDLEALCASGGIAMVDVLKLVSTLIENKISIEDAIGAVCGGNHKYASLSGDTAAAEHVEVLAGSNASADGAARI